MPTVTSLPPKKHTQRRNAFTILFTCSSLLALGNKIYELVLPLLMYQLSKSSVHMTTMRTAELLPNLLFAVFMGVIIDRVNKNIGSLV